MMGHKRTTEQVVRILAFSVLIVILIYSGKGYCLVCTRDLNGNGQIDPNAEKWTCLSSSPPLCPHDLTTCSVVPYIAIGSVSVAPTAVFGKSGFNRIAAGTGSIDFSGWSCSASFCSESYGGKISFSEGTVSGSAYAEKITRVTGSGDQLRIYGCSGSGCTEALVGSIAVSGATFSGSASASDGLIAVSANTSAITFRGTICNQSGCSTAVAGVITLGGDKTTCPYGSQYSCADVGGVPKCSQMSCFDETGGGEIGAGQKVCSKDLNGDGNIDFSSEVVTCTNIEGRDFCPIGAVNCGSGNMTPICPTDGRDCPGGTYNAALKRCETSQIVRGYRCPSNDSTYSDQASCQSACMQTANCSNETYGVSITADQSSSDWFYNGAYRMYCSGSGMYLTANSGGNNRSWSLSGTSCSGDANCGVGGAVTYLVGSGNQLLVYGCQGVWSDENQQYLRTNCGMLCGTLTFDHAVVGGSTRNVNCALDDASGLSFHDQCVWETWTTITISGASYQSCPLGNYPCNGGTCTAGSACTAIMGCPIGWQLVSNTCIAQPQGGTPITINEKSHLCEALSVNTCTGTGFGYDVARDSCVKNVDCGTGSLDGGLDLCVFTIGADRCPSGYAYSAAYSACLKDAYCSGEGALNALRDLCETANSPACTDGFGLDAVLNKCLAAPSCQIGTYDTGTAKCTISASILAPSGYVFNAALDRFELSPPPCPSGSTYSTSADLCTSAATITCPPPGSYNAASGKCEAATVPTCSLAGMTYDAVAGICQVASTCPAGGGVLHTSRDFCETNYTPVCAGSYVWNSATAKCELTPSCSSGTYNAQRNRCESVSTGMACPSGYTWNASAGKCRVSPYCSAGSYNPYTDRCELSATESYQCSTGGSYASLATCQSACMEYAACQTGYYSVWASANESSSYWFGNGAYQMYCSGSGLYLSAYPSGSNRSWTLYGTSCSGSAGGSGYLITQLAGSGNYLYVYGCPRDPEYGYCQVPYTYLGALYFSNAALSGSVGHGTYCPLDDASGAFAFHDQCNWSTWTSFSISGAPYEYCPLGGYPCTGGYCSTSASCSGPNYSCPGGWYLTGATCYLGASCAAGGSLNGASDYCETAGTPTCPTGTYDPANGVCYTAANCPNSGSLNEVTDKCQLSPTNACPANYALNTGLSVCQAPPQCSAGLYNTSRDRCEAASTQSCPGPGYYVWNASRSLCDSDMIHTCSVEGFLYSPSLDLCASRVACPGGGTLSGISDICTLQMTSGLCAPGFIYDPVSDNCLKDPCSAGTFNASLNKCEQDITANCPGGYSFNSNTGMCQMSPICDVGSSYDGGVDKCSISGAALCPAQYTFNYIGSRCEKAPVCDASSSYSASLDLCVETVKRHCPTSEYAYQDFSRMCTATPICYVGNFDRASNVCTGTGSNCPLGSQYECLPNPSTGILQCSNSTCFTMTNQATEKKTADTRGYVNDGTRDPNTGMCQGQAIIFNGRGRECRSSGMSTTFFNCCNTDPGSLWFIQNTCGSEELMTVRGLAAGNCHFVGDYCREEWPFIGCVQRANVYCCFGSKLSRIIHEQGRAQLQAFNGWGGAENPECRGFTPEEFQMLDFSKIDLSEYFSEIKNKAQSAIQQNMQQKVSEFYEKTK